MRNSNSGFTLIELLVVIVIIGILAAVAIPYYQGYMVRARLVEVEHAMSVVESAVTSYYQDREQSWPNCSTKDDISNSLGVSLGSITRISDISIINGQISVTVGNVHPMVNGKTIVLTPSPNPDGSVQWSWGYSADFPVNLRFSEH